MNENRQEGLEAWILEWFQRKQITQDDHAVARRFFLREFDQLQAGDGVDVLRKRFDIIDSDCAGFGSYGELMESQAEASLDCYKQAIDEGHGPAYAEVYGASAGSDDNPVESASRTAYESIRLGFVPSPDDPAYKDAYAACLKQTGSDELARLCAEFLYDYDFCYPRAFQAVKDHETMQKMMLNRGHSQLRATMYAQAVREDVSPQFAEVFARCVEEQVAAGRIQNEAEIFAGIYTDLFDEHGSFDEIYGCPNLPNDQCMALAEASYRSLRGIVEKG